MADQNHVQQARAEAAEDLDTAQREHAADETPASDDKTKTAEPDEARPQIAVQHTDIAIGAFREAFGDEAAQEFQAKVGDDALPTLAVAEGMLADDSKLRALYDEHEISDGALSVEGAYQAAEHLAARLGVGTKAHTTPQNIWLRA
jgi:hypothetical protein